MSQIANVNLQLTARTVYNTGEQLKLPVPTQSSDGSAFLSYKDCKKWLDYDHKKIQKNSDATQFSIIITMIWASLARFDEKILNENGNISQDDILKLIEDEFTVNFY